MAYEPVDVYVLSQSSLAPVESAVVSVYSTDGKQKLGQSTSDEDGKASFLLPGDAEYDLRFYRFATGFTQPLRISVVSDPATPGKTPNEFNAYANPFEHPQAIDPRLCRASGYFRAADGAPRPQLDIHFIACFRPAIIDGSLVMDERRVIKTDKNGFGCIDLIRCAIYSVTIEHYEDQLRQIRVPDAPSANLPDLLFPVVDRVIQDDVSVALGADLELTPTIVDSAGVPLPGTAQYDVNWTLEDPTVASLTVTESYLLVHGLAKGSTQLLAERRDNSIVRIPATGITGVPVPVAVT
jgi:hypothetical protein